MRAPRGSLEIFLVSLGLLLLEVSYTRIFSYKLVYYFTYLIIGVALLGLGAGGVLVSMVDRLRRAPFERLVPACALVAGTGTLASYLVVALVQLNAFDLTQAVGLGPAATALREGAKLLLIVLALFVPFLAGGLVVAVVLSTGGEHANRLYAADLLGASLACVLAVPLMATISPPGCVMVAGLALAASGLPLALAHARPARWPLLAVVLAAAGAALAPGRLPDVVVDSVKTMSPQQAPDAIFSSWSPVFRVDVLRNDHEKRGGYALSHDGMWGSVLMRFDGDFGSLGRYDADDRAFPFSLLAPGPRVVVIGSAGGNELLASLHFGASAVTGVELNPVTVSLLERRFADYTGHLAADPRVRIVNDEGRAFLTRDDERYDLVWFVAPDSYAAMNSAMAGAYVLSESYLYTAEMLAESLRSLRPGGVVCAQFGELNFERKPNRTARYVATARAAFRMLGIDDPAAHVLVATSPGFLFATSTVVLKREPFTPDEVARFTAAVARREGGLVRQAPGAPRGTNPVNEIATRSDAALAEWYRTYPFDVRPVTDDAPFFWHFVSFRQALANAAAPNRLSLEDGIGERLLVVLVVLATLLGGAFVLCPLAFRRAVWREVPYKRWTALYFGALGLGFMFFEVSLIQRLTLFLGYPTYSLTVTLFAMLLATGAGAFASDRLMGAALPPLGRLLLALALLVAFYLGALGPIVAALAGAPLGVRILVAVAVVAPLGLCLGVFMPMGLRVVQRASRHAEEYVAWAWAINGFCSVVSSMLATILSMVLGFDAVMVVALGIYAVGIAALARIPWGAAG